MGLRTQPIRAPPAHEVKFTALDLQGVDADGAFEGYASLFNREDLGRDIVAARRLPRQPARARRRRHQDAVPARRRPSRSASGTTLAEDARGLYVRGRLMRDVAKAREVHALMRAGALDGLSIGFRTVKGRRDRATGVRRLEKVDLWEISVVTFPMLPEARVAAVKARPFAGELADRTRIRALAHAGCWADANRGPGGAALGLQGLTTLRDAGADRSRSEASP